MTVKAHTHFYVPHPNEPHFWACRVCGFAIPEKLLEPALNGGAGAEPEVKARVHAARIARINANRASIGLPPVSG